MTNQQEVFEPLVCQINWVEEISNSRINPWYKILHSSYSKGNWADLLCFQHIYEEILEVKQKGTFVFPENEI